MLSQSIKTSENEEVTNPKSKMKCFVLEETKSIMIYTSEICKIYRFYCEKKNKFFCIKTYNPCFNLIALSELYINQKIKTNLTIKRKTIIKFFSSLNFSKDKTKREIFSDEIEKNNLKNKISLSGQINLVFEYSPFGNIIDFINAYENYFLSLNNIKCFLNDIIKALKELHKIGIVHNDLKLDNILFLKNKKKLIAKICDFNNSILLNDTQYNSKVDYDSYKFGFYEKPQFNSDYFELGIVLFQIVFFENPLKYLRKIKKITCENLFNKLNIISNIDTDNLYKNNPFKIDIELQKSKYLPFNNENANECFNLNLNENAEFRLYRNYKLKDLIFNLLQINPGKRLNDENLSKHEFFKKDKIRYNFRPSKIKLLKNLRTKKLVRRLTS